jgi:hypothetical protein
MMVEALIAVLVISAVLRFSLLIYMDHKIKKNIILRLVFGVYGLESFIPFFRHTDFPVRKNLILTSRVCLIVFYFAVGMILLNSCQRPTTKKDLQKILPGLRYSNIGRDNKVLGVTGEML